MAVNGEISKTSFSEISTKMKISPTHIDELRQAITKLQGYAANVDNCGNCVYCQTCQSYTCQTTTCQSSSCQTTSCQICQTYSCERMQCNCDCGDDTMS